MICINESYSSYNPLTGNPPPTEQELMLKKIGEDLSKSLADGTFKVSDQSTISQPKRKENDNDSK